MLKKVGALVSWLWWETHIQEDVGSNIFNRHLMDTFYCCKNGMFLPKTVPTLCTSPILWGEEDDVI